MDEQLILDTFEPLSQEDYINKFEQSQVENESEEDITKDINWRVNTSYTSYNRQVRSSNHGIKEKNILSIFLPIGIKISEIDEDILLLLITLAQNVD
ncbi:hypothetical protein WKS99_05735 [Flintibacter sp. HCN-6482]|uniref:hypothetical protein n=1 Tax=Flintibacter sp. HCN-6482 TaxID=3134672 RepID=UPI0030BA491C